MNQDKLPKVQFLGQMLYTFAIFIDSSKAAHHSQLGIFVNLTGEAKVSQSMVNKYNFSYNE